MIFLNLCGYGSYITIPLDTLIDFLCLGAGLGNRDPILLLAINVFWGFGLPDIPKPKEFDAAPDAAKPIPVSATLRV